MHKIILGTSHHTDLTIMIFVEGTILRPKSWLTLYNHNGYLPIGNAVSIIKSWQQQGANIIYCTSRKKNKADVVGELLKKHKFAGDFLIAREAKEKYKDIVEAIQPDILIEDDCRSIGGAWQMCITKVNSNIKRKIISKVVPEFKGIDKLPADVRQLQKR